MLLFNIYFIMNMGLCGFWLLPESVFKIKRLTFVKQSDIFRLTDVERQERQR